MADADWKMVMMMMMVEKKMRSEWRMLREKSGR
jgi:hypothetical protein